MSAQEFQVGQSISGTDYDRLPVGAKFRRGPQYSEYEVTETGFKLGMADTRLTAADYRSARKITYLPATVEPEDKDDLYVEPEHVTEPSVDNSEDLTKPEDADDVEPEPLKGGQRTFNDDDVQRLKVTHGSEVLFDGLAVFEEAANGNVLVTPVPRCTSLFVKPGSPLSGIVRCGQHEGHGHGHWTIGSDPAMSWNDAMEYGRMIQSGGAS